MRNLSRKPEVREDLANDAGVLDGREQPHAAATARTGEHVELEGASHQVGPGPVAGLAGSIATGPGNGRPGRVGDGYPRRDHRVLVGDGLAAPAGMRGKDTMGEHQIDAGARDKCSELLEEFEGLV